MYLGAEVTQAPRLPYERWLPPTLDVILRRLSAEAFAKLSFMGDVADK